MRSPAATSSLCTSIVASPYSSWYVASTVARGSLPFLRIGMNALPSLYAMGMPKRNPRDSRPAMASNSTPSRQRHISSTARRRPSALRRTEVMSRKMIPGSGKSGMLVMYWSIVLAAPVSSAVLACSMSERLLIAWVSQGGG